MSEQQQTNVTRIVVLLRVCGGNPNVWNGVSTKSGI